MPQPLGTALKNKGEAIRIAAKNASNLNVVRWYLMIYPFGRKGVVMGLDREIKRRKNMGEPPIEYFAPICVEAKEEDGKIVRTEKQLFHNYVFVRASIKELFRMKQYEEQYNFPRRETTATGEHHYPHVSDEVILNLKWIARSYSGVIPVYTGDTSWLVKGDRIRVTSGPLKGIEANLFDNRQKKRKEIMVVIENWMTIPLLRVKESHYKVIALNDKTHEKENFTISDEQIPRLHHMLCRLYDKKGLSAEEHHFAKDLIEQYKGKEPASDIMRCKLYSILLMAYTILNDKEKYDKLAGFINAMLPSIKAQQSKALLLTALYGCTDNSLYHCHAHQIVDPWKQEDSPKKSKQQLIDRLADYDRCFKH